jgi:hypothetical protein
MKSHVFSSVADENAFIFVNFIPSAYFHRPTDEYIYFRRLSGYFQRFLVDEIKLFSCSGRVGRYQKKVARVGSLESDSEEDNEVWLVEWTRNKKPVSCLLVKANIEKYSFDVNKANQIFDFLLREKQIQLSSNHNIPMIEELKNKKYYKWHNSNSHSANECNVFHQQMQSAIEQGRIQIEERIRSR